MMEKSEMYPGKIMMPKPFLVWIGTAYDHLYCVLSDGRTFRLDKFIESNDATGKIVRKWVEVAQIPL